MKKKILVGAFAALYGFICMAAGWVAGVDSGFDTGYRTAYIEMDHLLRQGINERAVFYIQGLDIAFSPVAKDTVQIADIRKE